MQSHMYERTAEFGLFVNDNLPQELQTPKDNNKAIVMDKALPVQLKMPRKVTVCSCLLMQ